MNLTNYHSHTLYCDGRAGMEDFIRFAISQDLHPMVFLRMLRYRSLPIDDGVGSYGRLFD